MIITGEFRISASRDAVWTALRDPDMLRQIIPGCRALTRHPDGAVEATLAAAVGPQDAEFRVEARPIEVDAPARLKVAARADGGEAGTAHGTVTISLADDGGGTILRYRAEGEVTGRLEQAGGALVDATGKRLAHELFHNLAARLARDSGFTDRLDHTMAGVPLLGDEPSEDVVVDKMEEAGEIARQAEERIEVAAGRGVLGGPVMWGVLALLVVIIVIYFLSRPA